jgi:hypothetical protein
MPEIIGWQKSLVVQKDMSLGCIPTGYEFLIRVSGIEGVDLSTFQDEFNLQARNIDNNSFDSVANAVEQKYQDIKIDRKAFPTGREKVDFVKDLLEQGKPCLLSLIISKGNYHIMPVIYIDDSIMITIHHMESSGIIQLLRLDLRDVIYRHDNYSGGNDVAWL